MPLTKAHNRVIAGSVVNVVDFGAVGDGVTDDTTAIQAAIDSATEGTVFFPTGTYLCSGITTRNYLTLLGEGPNSSILKHSETSGSLITLHVDCSYFEMNSMSISGQSSSGTTGIDGTNEYVRNFRLSNFIISGFETGCYIQAGLDLIIEKGYISCFGSGAANGTTGLKLGDKPLAKACTTTTVRDVFFTNADTGFYNRAAPCSITRPIFETSQYGLKSFTRAVIINPFFSACSVADAFLEDNGALFLGPFKAEQNIVYDSATEELRSSFIGDSSGDFKVGRLELTETPNELNSSAPLTVTSGVDDSLLNAVATNATYSAVGAIRADIARNTTGNNFQPFVYYNTGAAEVRWQVEDSGTVKNKTGTYGTLSDQKLKQDIVDASSQWGDIKDLRVCKYRLKNDVANNPDAPYMLGLIAQEVESVSPGLIEESFDTTPQEVNVYDENGDQVFDKDGNPVTQNKHVRNGETTKAVKQSIVYMKALKALQEAMERIEQLEARVATLES